MFSCASFCDPRPHTHEILLVATFLLCFVECFIFVVSSFYSVSLSICFNPKLVFPLQTFQLLALHVLCMSFKILMTPFGKRKAEVDGWLMLLIQANRRMDWMLFHKHGAISYACMNAIHRTDLQLSHICNSVQPRFLTPTQITGYFLLIMQLFMGGAHVCCLINIQVQFYKMHPVLPCETGPLFAL